ncbi:MAG: hypothetical protein JKY56_07425 [Kofleriaceae bacterium]|nr:hypothetical protein [Kofleriaceae bacterium]
MLRLSVLALIGALAAGPVAAFIAELGSSPNSTNADIALLGENRWLYAIAIVGLTQEASKYLVATLPILRSSECRSGDQVISLQASSIGFAAFVSYQHLRSPGLHTSLTGAAILTITLTLTHLTLSGTVSAIASLLTRQSRARVPGQFAMSTAIVSAAILTAAALNGSILMVSDTPRFHLGIVLFSFVAVHLFAPRITLAPPVSRFPQLLATALISVFFGVALLHLHSQRRNFLQLAEHKGLQFSRPRAWKESILAPSSILSYAPHEKAGHKIEAQVVIASRYPIFAVARTVAHHSRYGSSYRAIDSSEIALGSENNTWLRTSFHYREQLGSNEIQAIEYARRQDGRVYLLTLHSSSKGLIPLDRLVSPTITAKLTPEAKK